MLKNFKGEKLTDMQREVTQNDGTEPPFQNEYWDNKRDGLYVDIIDGTPLFTSKDKFDSGCGWPSFTRPIDSNDNPLQSEKIKFKEDTKFGMKRTEVRSEGSDSHLGHVFDDGPPGTGGMRYCINSASLKFIPLDDLESEGYGNYIKYFNK